MARASDRRVLIGAASLARNRLGLTIESLSLFLFAAIRTEAKRRELPLTVILGNPVAYSRPSRQFFGK